MSDPAPNRAEGRMRTGRSLLSGNFDAKTTWSSFEVGATPHRHSHRRSGLPLHSSPRSRNKSAWSRLVQAYEKFKADEPGQRFLHAYQRWGGSMASWKKVVLTLAGTILVIVGILLALVPGVPGIIMGVGGLALLALRSRTLALGLDSAEFTWRRWWRKMRPRKSTSRG